MTLRSISEALLEQDLTLANAMLEASHLITPQGTLDVVYDERGRVYKVPRYCFATPQELTLLPAGEASFNPPMSSSAKSGNLKSDSQRQRETESTGGGGQSMQLKVRINPGTTSLSLSLSF